MPLSVNTIRELCVNVNSDEIFNSLLSFISEFCNVSHAYISIIGADGTSIKAEKNFKFSVLPDNILLLNENIIQQNRIFVSNKEESNSASNEDSTFHFFYEFFMGLPICINESLVVGTLCIIDKNKRSLTPLQLKGLDQAVLQIKLMLELHLKNVAPEIKENQFEFFINSSQEVFYEVSLDGLIKIVSPNWNYFIGHEESEIIGKRVIDFIHPEDQEKYSIALLNLSSGYKFLQEFTARIILKNGIYVWSTISMRIVERNGIQYYKGNFHNITDYSNGHQRLEVQKEFYEKILHQLPTEIAVFDANYKYLFGNNAIVGNDGLRKFFKGNDNLEYSKYSDKDILFAKKRHANFMQAVQNKKVVEWEDVIQHADGSNIFYTRKFVPVFLNDGTLDIMIELVLDITKNKVVEQEILKSKQLSNSVIQNIAVGILVQGPASEILENNKAACQMLGISEDQLRGRTSYDERWRVINFDGATLAVEEFPVVKAIRERKQISNIVMGVHRPLFNDLVWLLVDAIPIFDDDNELLYVVCSFNDFTARKIAEDAVKISNERFIYSSMATSDVLWDWNIVTDEMFVADSYSELFGYRFEKNSLTEHECENFIHNDDKKDYILSTKNAINSSADRWAGEYRYLKFDGTYAYVNDKAVIIRNSEGIVIRMIGAMQDITKEKLLKEELRQSEEQFKGAFEQSSVGLAFVSID